MFTLLWNLSTALRGYLRYYMPTNRVIDWLRTPGGQQWGIRVPIIATAAYLALTCLAVEGATHSGIGWLNTLVMLFYWNAMKFAWMAVVHVPLMLRTERRRWRGRACGMPQRWVDSGR